MDTEWKRTTMLRRIRETWTPDTVLEWRRIQAIIVQNLASTSMLKL